MQAGSGVLPQAQSPSGRQPAEPPQPGPGRGEALPADEARPRQGWPAPAAGTAPCRGRDPAESAGSLAAAVPSQVVECGPCPGC